MEAGDYFYNQATPTIPSHPWVIISDTSVDADNVVIVNFTDAETHHDSTCVFEVSELSWLTKRSCIAYQYAKLTSVNNLILARDKRLLFNFGKVSIDVLDRIREGASESQETRNDCLEILRSQS